jgi:formylglycine-generating enzyme required for sulfatase activity/lipoprotein NlpI
MRKFLFPMAVPLLLLSAAVPASDTGSGAPALQDPRIQCLKMGGDPLADEAIRVCTEALASEKKKPGETALFYLYRGNAYAEKQLVDQAYSDYREALKHDGRLSQAYFGLGMLFLHEGDYQGAEQEFNKALELKPGYQDAKEILARIMAGQKLRERNFPSAVEAEERGDFRAAAYLYTELLESDALAGARFPTFAVYDNRANVHLAQKQYPAAVTDFNAALELNPDYVPALYNRGSAYSVMGRFDLGVADYTRVIGLEPENASAYFNRGNAYAGMNQYRSAIRDYKKALELKPDWEKVESTLAEAESISKVYEIFLQGLEAERSGAYDEAIARYTEVLESGRLDARNTANIYYARARVHMRLKAYPQSLHDLRRAVELKPRWKALRKTLEAVEAEAAEMQEGEGDGEGLGKVLADWLGDSAEQADQEQESGQETAPPEETADKTPTSEEDAQPKTDVAENHQAEKSETVADEAPEEAQQPSQQIVDKYKPGESFQECDDCPQMVVVPPGSFHMGDTMGTGSGVERPAHGVTIDYSFAIAKHETTFAQWDACVTDGGCIFKPSDDGLGRGTRPVAGVSWQDAQEYLTWLSKKTARQYRLPTEAEWEYVARSEAIGDNHWEALEETCKHVNAADQMLREKDPQVAAVVCRDGFIKTAPVGSFLPNTFGVHDMYGNVSEWVEDCWNADYQEAPTDGQAWVSGQCDRRVLRGGSWKSGPQEIRASSRQPLWQEQRVNTSGLRVVRRLVVQPENAE